MQGLFRLHPFQGSFTPGINKAENQDAQEYEHLHQSEQAKLLKGHRPGEKENDLNIENNKYQSENIITDIVLNPGCADGGFAAFVVLKLDLTGPVRTKQPGSKESDQDKAYAQDEKYSYYRVIIRHFKSALL
jgi:hypothetical protein